MWLKSSHCGASNTCAEVKVWRRSTECSNEANCTEVAHTQMGVEIRDSKFPEMQHIKLNKKQFETFLYVLKNN